MAVETATEADRSGRLDPAGQVGSRVRARAAPAPHRRGRPLLPGARRAHARRPARSWPGWSTTTRSWPGSSSSGARPPATWPTRRSTSRTARAEVLALAVELRDLLAESPRHRGRPRSSPASTRCSREAELEAIDARVKKSLPKKGLSFALPWNVEALDPATREELIAHGAVHPAPAVPHPRPALRPPRRRGLRRHPRASPRLTGPAMRSGRRAGLHPMATFVLIPGAGSDSWYWHLVEPELRAAGHDVVAVDLPVRRRLRRPGRVHRRRGRRRSATAATTSCVVGPVDGRVHRAAGVRAGAGELIVLVAAMTPRAGRDAGGDWWANTGSGRGPAAAADARRRAERGFDDGGDVPARRPGRRGRRVGAAHVRDQSGTPFEEPWPLDALARRADPVPALPRRPLLPGRLPAAGRAASASGSCPTRWTAATCPALAHPEELARRLLAYAAEVLP